MMQLGSQAVRSASGESRVAAYRTEPEEDGRSVRVLDEVISPGPSSGRKSHHVAEGPDHDVHDPRWICRAGRWAG